VGGLLRRRKKKKNAERGAPKGGQWSEKDIVHVLESDQGIYLIKGKAAKKNTCTRQRPEDSYQDPQKERGEKSLQRLSYPEEPRKGGLIGDF